MRLLIHIVFATSILASCNNSADYNVQGENVPPDAYINIAPIDVSFDTAHVKTNTADLKVTLMLKNYYFLSDTMYGPREKKRDDLPEFDFGESLMWGTNVTQIGTQLCFSGTVLLTDSNAAVSKNKGFSTHVKDTIPTFEFQNFHEGGIYQMELGQLIIEAGGLQCMDTGINRPIIKNEKGIVDFGWLGNLKLFEYDLNTDGEKEIYVISYQTCVQYVAIYKIENSTS
jgi:hypothetical protein